MKKEIVWVVAFGIVIGLVVAFGFFRINSSMNKQPNNQPSPTPKVVNSEFKITLDKPDDDDVVTTSPLTVSGITKPLAWITVSGESGDYILQSSDDGSFSQDVDLETGVNQIKITAFDPNGAESIQKVLVVYSSSFQLSEAPALPADGSTDSAIRQKVAEKVQAALNKPKAYIGVVTDIADSTIQIKTQESQIEQISTSDDGITVVNAKGTTNKTVKLTDVAIGDFIVAMGYVNGNSVLKAQRILITAPIEDPKIDAYMGKVTDTSKKSVTVNSEEVIPDKNTDLGEFVSGKVMTAKLGTFSEGDSVIYVKDSSKATPSFRSVFLVQKT